MLEPLKNFFAPNWFIPHTHSQLELAFMPHGMCYLWKPDLVLLHVVSDSLIALAYYSIPLTLFYFIQKRRDVPFTSMFLLFGAFIVSCGTTHLMEIWTLWHPAYWLSGSMKAATAIVSCYTAAELVWLIPTALTLPSPAQLKAANQKLAGEIIERKLAEAALRESEIRFRSIFEGAAIGISLADMTGRVVATNPALQRMLGYSESEWRELSIPDITHPDDITASCEYYQELIAQKRDCYQIEKRYIHKEGQLVWGRLTVSLVSYASSKPEYIIGMVEDITDRKQTEEALRQYQEHLEVMVEERTVELTKANEQLFWQANHDKLTGCANRHAFEQQLSQAVVSANSHQEHTLCYLDLDRFKIVNDTCGHVAGDELLCQVSELLKTKCRKTDIVARLGGDEFALLLYQCPLEQGMRVAQLLLESIQAFRFVWRGKLFNIGTSIGVVAIDAESQSADSVLNAADAACYAAKNRGRNRVHVYHADDRELAKAKSEVQWVARIERAIADNRFCLYYQPIASLSADSAAGEHYEVLLRMVDETGELIPPMAFLPAAERFNLMPAIDKWVIRTFFAHLSKVICQRSEDSIGLQVEKLAATEELNLFQLASCTILNNGSAPRPENSAESKFTAKLKPFNLQTSPNKSLYAVNVSGASVNDDRFVDFIKEQFDLYQVPPELICFEITETIAIANLNKAARVIEELRNFGCHFALDDFGSGMSSFAYLKHLPVDYMKIDGTFVKDIADDPIDCAMLEAINHIGHVMGLQTIAEFVANDSILEKVKTLGVDYAQGYGIATPQPLY